ncbi:MAG: ABC transporter substrate-binding protein [Anaerolineae bacterium]
MRSLGRRLLSLTALLLLLGACEVPGAVHPTVKIGLVAPFEGRYRYVGYDLFPAVRQALREVNGAGGVGSYYVELVAYDDGANPAMAAEQARKLVVDPEVVAVIGHFRAQTTAAALPIYAREGLPLVAAGVLDLAPVAGEGVVIRPGPDAEAVAAALLDRVDGAALIGGSGPLAQALRESGQLAPVVSPDDPAWLEAVLAVDPPAVICDAEPVAAGEIVAAMQEAGWDGEFLGGPQLAAADFAAVAGEAAQGTLFVTPWPLPEDVESGAELTAYTEISGGTEPGPLALPAYEAARLMVEALRADIAADGTPSRAGVAAALASLAEERELRQGYLYWYRIGAAGALEQIAPPSSP